MDDWFGELAPKLLAAAELPAWTADTGERNPFGLRERACADGVTAVFIDSIVHGESLTGVYRSRPGVQTGDEYRQRLEDLELKAAKLGRGVWRYTDWAALPAERRQQRSEEAELAAAKDGPTIPDKESVDPNSAPRALLMKLPGIGETMANRIIEGRAAEAAPPRLLALGLTVATLSPNARQSSAQKAL